MNKLEPGLLGQTIFIVEEKHLAPTVGSGEARVFSTPMLVAGMEAAAVAAIAKCLEPGHTSVGIHMDVWHTASTPLGVKITFSAALTEISANGKKLVFTVRAEDAHGEIGHGLHERAIVEKDAFEKRAGAKARPSAR